jgi:pyridoxamine 5'-phosphate oxidase
MSDGLWHSAQYEGAPLDPADCDPDPLIEVERWVSAAIAAGIGTANAMTLACVDERGRPSARIVLLKGIDRRGLVFFTNYQSRKGRELAANPHAALVLYWERLHRQIRVEGAIERIAAGESDAYFSSRPRGSQLGAIASPQSEPLASRAELEARVAEVERVHGAAPLARPDYWGGYRVVPDAVELWQGRPSRLHDRVRYARSETGWARERLAP